MEQIATHIGRAYAGVEGVAAVMIAGSVGRGRSDEFSDIEVDVYWSAPPTPEQRGAGVQLCSGTDPILWDYDADEEEYSEDFRVDGVSVGISGFTVPTMECILDRLDEFRLTDQLRLSALTSGRPVAGQALITGWQERAVYGDDLQRATVDHYLDSIPARRWCQVSALVARRDWLTLRQICDQSLEGCVGLWCAANRCFVEHPRFKWSAVIVDALQLVPHDAAHRLVTAAAAPLPQAVALTRSLTLDTLKFLNAYDATDKVASVIRAMQTPR